MLGNTIFGGLLSQLPPAPNSINNVTSSAQSNVGTSNVVPSVTFSVVPQNQHQHPQFFQYHPQPIQQPQQQQQQNLLTSVVSQLPVLANNVPTVIVASGATHAGLLSSIQNATVVPTGMNTIMPQAMSTSGSLSFSNSIDSTIEEVVSSLAKADPNSISNSVPSTKFVCNKPFSCSECGKVFTRKYQLERHKLLHNPGQETFQCPDCPEVFHVRESFLLHIRIHVKPDPTSYRCDLCNLVFNNKTSLTKHRRQTHPNQPPYRRVNNIGITGNTLEDIKAIQSSSNAPRPLPNSHRIGTHVCYTCGKKFMNRYGLQRHSRTHTGERPHDCDICGLSFMERSHMRQHRMTHTGETPYHCGLCKRGFNRKYSYQRHLRWHAKSTLAPAAINVNDHNLAEEKNGDSITDLLNRVVAEPVNNNASNYQSCGGHVNVDAKPIIAYAPSNAGFTQDGNTFVPLGASFTMQLNPVGNLQATNSHVVNTGMGNVPQGYTTGNLSMVSTNGSNAIQIHNNPNLVSFTFQPGLQPINFISSGNLQSNGNTAIAMPMMTLPVASSMNTFMAPTTTISHSL